MEEIMSYELPKEITEAMLEYYRERETEKE